MRVRSARPLRPFVSGYVDFDMAGWPPGRHRGLPDGTLALVVSVGPPLTVRRAGHADVLAAATVAGLRSGPVGIVHDGASAVVDEDYPEVVDAVWRRLAVCASRVPVSTIAAELGLSRRHLGQPVRAELGLTPKTVARILRRPSACREMPLLSAIPPC